MAASMNRAVQILIKRLKYEGYITTLVPGNRVLAAVVAQLSGITVPKTKKDRWVMIRKFAALPLSIPTALTPIVEAPKKEKRPKNPTKVQFKAFYLARRWRTLRYEALKIHGAACQCCGGTAKSTGRPMHVDHIKPRSKFPELELTLSNLQVLCEDCNMGKGGHDQTDWRP